MSGPNFNFLFAPVPPTASDRFLSNFQGVLGSPSCTTYCHFFISDLRSAGGHDLVNLSLLDFVSQIAPNPKILEISAYFIIFVLEYLNM